MLNEAHLRDDAADAVPAAGATDAPRTSRRLLLGGSLAALGLAAGGLPRLSPITPAAAWMFWPRIAATTSLAERPRCATFCGSSQTRIA